MSNKMLLSEKIYRELRDRISINEFNEGEYLPSERDLMKSYGVSRVTIRKALSNLESDKLVQRRPGVGYCILKQSSANNQKASSNSTIGLILSEELDTQTKGIQILQRMISDLGYSIFYGVNGLDLEKENDCIDRFITAGVEGIVIIPAVHGSGPSSLANLIDKKFPVVAVGEPRSWCVGYRYINKMSIVGLDNISVMNLMMEQLVEMGHNRIIYVNDITMKDVETIRKRVFSEFLSHNNLPSDYENSVHIAPMVLNSGKSELAAILKNKKKRPTAIICQSVTISTSVIHMLDSLGLNVPNDISVTTFGLKEQGQNFFSSVDYSGENYAYEITDSLLLQIKGQHASKKVQIMSEFIERKSTINKSVKA